MQRLTDSVVWLRLLCRGFMELFLFSSTDHFIAAVYGLEDVFHSSVCPDWWLQRPDCCTEDVREETPLYQ